MWVNVQTGNYYKKAGSRLRFFIVLVWRLHDSSYFQNTRVSVLSQEHFVSGILHGGIMMFCFLTLGCLEFRVQVPIPILVHSGTGILLILENTEYGHAN